MVDDGIEDQWLAQQIVGPDKELEYSQCSCGRKIVKVWRYFHLMHHHYKLVKHSGRFI